jgi:hypothetical protein
MHGDASQFFFRRYSIKGSFVPLGCGSISIANNPGIQSNLLVHSARGIFLPRQHLQPGPWPEPDANRL